MIRKHGGRPRGLKRGVGETGTRHVSLSPRKLDERRAQAPFSSDLAGGRNAGDGEGKKTVNSNAPASRATFPLREQRGREGAARWRTPPRAAPGDAGRGGGKAERASRPRSNGAASPSTRGARTPPTPLPPTLTSQPWGGGGDPKQSKAGGGGAVGLTESRVAKRKQSIM